MPAAARAGFSAERLQVLDRVLREDYVERGDVPGAAIQVWRRGELAHAGLWGWMDREAKTPLREDAIFRIYSMTKPITGAAILMLMEQGWSTSTTTFRASSPPSLSSACSRPVAAAPIARARWGGRRGSSTC